MPTPVTPRRPSNRKSLTPGRKPLLDTSKAAGRNVNSSVQDRIKQWQAQGGGVVTASDIIDTLAEEPAADYDGEIRPRSRQEYKTMPAKPRTPRRRVDSLTYVESDPRHRRRSRRQEPGSDERAARQARSVSAPRRRILSDGHWRKERSPTRDSTPNPEDGSSRPSWALPDDGIRARRTTESDLDKDVKRHYRSLPHRSRPPPAEQNIQISSYDTPIDTIEDAQSDEPEHVSPADTLCDKSLNFHSPTPSMREDPVGQSDGEHSTDFEAAGDLRTHELRPPRQDSRIRHTDRDHARTMPRTLRDKGKQKTSKTGILGQVVSESKKIFTKAEPPIATPRAPTIESWLNDTPDPFVDDLPSPNNEVPPIPEELEPVLPKNLTPTSSAQLTKSRREKVQRGSSDAIRPLECSEEATAERSARRHKSRVWTAASNPADQAGGTLESVSLRSANKDTAKSTTDYGTASSTLRRRGARRKSVALPAEWMKSVSTKQENSKSRAVTAEATDAGTNRVGDPIKSASPLRPREHNESPKQRRHVQPKLSTIASVDTSGIKDETADKPNASTTSAKENDLHANEQDSYASELQDRVDANGLDHWTSRSRITKHDDLMSVLSMPRGEGSHHLRSARSIRSTRSRFETATLPDLMKELAADEGKYLRELRTLVDGVIPVLLTSILSKADAAAAIGLFSRRKAKDDPSLTKPIYDMGIALERLKRAHKRIPLEHPEAFLVWARGSENVYREYLKAWRMGFQDVIVNLAPATENQTKPRDTGSAISANAELPRDANGDVLGNEGERVDVAFLLKRPLVRLKYLSKTIRGIQSVKPTSETENLSKKYQALVDQARDRANEERARLEDEAAADIDSTKAREPQTLSHKENVTIDENRRVRARDCFDLTLVHSSGQTIDCRVEMILREDQEGNDHGGDVLICELDGTGRWLLFPPVHTSCISARNGDAKGEVVVMLRGISRDGDEWHELLILHSDEEEAGFEWVQMLGLVPIPPRITRGLSFMERRRKNRVLALPAPDSGYASNQATIEKSVSPTPELDVPLGEARRKPHSQESDPLVPAMPSGLRARLQKRQPQAAIPTSQNEGADVSSSLDESLPRSPHARSRQRRRTLGGVFDSEADSKPQHALDDYTGQSGHRRQASAPAEELPPDSRLATNTPPLTPTQEDEPAWPSPASSPRTPNKLSKKRPQSADGTTPTPPAHPSGSPESATPILKSSSKRNAPTSPLKHEYDPSTASASYSESDSSSIAHDVSSDTDTEDEADLEDGDIAMPLMPVGALNRFKKSAGYAKSPGTIGPSESASQAPYKAVPSQPNKQVKTIASIFHWTDKGAWESLHPDECSINVTPGLIEAFQMSAMHSFNKTGLAPVPEDSLPTESPCTSRSSSANRPRPLVGLELTPLVPIRRGTALDISVRSPPTSESQLPLPKNAHILFRSRSAEECDALYALINHARINNPTYIALQHARATSYNRPFGGASFHTPGADAAGDKVNSRHSWFGFGFGSKNGSSYRASLSTPTGPRVSDPSVGGASVSSAFSALRRFGLRSERFSIARSTITSRQGDRSVFSNSDRSSSSGTSTPLPQNTPVGETMGLTNAKIRLYLRESASKWRDLGSARLTVMRPNEAGGSSGEAATGGAGLSPAAAAAATATATAAASTAAADALASTPRDTNRPLSQQDLSPTNPTLRAPGAPRPIASTDRRVVIVSAKKAKTLLDVTLGESCFERVARTGIAVSVWETLNDGKTATKVGGVVAGRLKVYMVQMGGEAEAAYTFGIVGRMRY